MKKILTILSLILSAIPTFAFAAVSPAGPAECETWVNQLNEIAPEVTSQETLKLAPGKTLRELIEHLGRYPSLASMDVSVHADENMEKAVARMIGTHACKILPFYSAVQKAWSSKLSSPSQKKELYQVVLRKIGERKGLSSTLLEASIFIRLVEQALESKVAKVDRVDYLEMGAIRYELDRVIANARLQDPYGNCPEKKNCSEEQFRKVFDAWRIEETSAKALLSRLHWWASRPT